MVNQYKPGDIVTSSLTRESDFIGVVRGVDPKINKVWVAWAGGAVGQHDPDEIHFEPHQSEIVKSRMASRRPFAGRTAATHQEISKGVRPSRPCKAGDLFHSGRGLQCGNCGAYTEDHGKTWEMAPEGKSRRSAADPATDPQFVGDPAAHGMDKPIGGGFSIMQNLVKDQRQEMHEESQGGQPKMAKSVKATGEMGSHDIQPGGEHYGWAQDVEKAAKKIQRFTKNKVRFKEMRPFDVYQGPYALLTSGKLWSGEREGEYFFDYQLGAEKGVTGTPDEIAEAILSYLKSRKGSDEGLRSRRATKKTAGYLKEKFPNLYQKAMRTYGNDPLYVAVMEADDVPSLNKAMQTLKSIRGSVALANLRWFWREGLKTAALRSRRAMYWSNPDRIYRLTKREIVDSSALCPRCRVEMSLEPYTKNDRMYCCSQCKFKIPKSNVIVASLKSRRAAVSVTAS
jgi:hypothetical protein